MFEPSKILLDKSEILNCALSSTGMQRKEEGRKCNIFPEEKVIICEVIICKPKTLIQVQLLIPVVCSTI